MFVETNKKITEIIRALDCRKIVVIIGGVNAELIWLENAFSNRL